MSGNDDEVDVGQREVAYRLFAAEFDDADFSFSESDEERAPNYVITPTGARLNRLFVVGVLTEVESVGDEVLRARVVDPTGAFVLYAGQYQPDEMAFLERADTPAFVAITGKARTFQPEDSDAIYTSIRPESISTVDAETRDRWTVQAAEQTLQRIGHMAAALSMEASGEELEERLRDNGVAPSQAAGIPLAIDHYETTPNYLSALRKIALDAARVVTGDIDEVESFSTVPDATGDADLDALVDSSVVSAVPTGEDVSASAGETDSEPQTETSAEPTPAETEQSVDAEPERAEAETETKTDVETGVASEPNLETETAATSADTSETEPATEQSAVGEEAVDDDLGDFEPGEFDLDEDEREEIESEYGTEFQSGTDVPEPGEADIDTPDPEELAEPEGEQPEATPADTAEDSGSDGADAEESTPEQPESEPSAGEEETAEAEDVDIEDAVIDVMEELDEGEGTPRTDLVATVTDRYGVSEADVEDAIQEALMGGRCYEPDDTTLKSI